ncbi:hypothetical protein Nepgr_005029 [Nepenthes gracilis]|uniref:Glycosyltransferase n=1 Tax=Nepenthes gracilis TaxID=150966 RepID=A0AAD3S2F0_NEPGR|nr:hypothetical protein Nepgr_005029 [Nepenthes gracilis]
MKKAGLIFIPALGAGHLVSMVGFARRLLERDSRFSITILLTRLSFSPDTAGSKSFFAATDDTIRYSILPDVELPPAEVYKEAPEVFITDYMDSHKPHVRDFVAKTINSGPNSAPVVGLVLDLFCTSMIDVANERDIPSYLFYTSGAAFMGLMLYLPTHYENVRREFMKSDPETIFPSYKNPFPSTLAPPFLLRKAGYITCAAAGRRYRETKGIIVNTFSELEPYAVSSFLDGRTPPVYTVGPILDLLGQAHVKTSADEHVRIMRWLDAQPESSVVFLCFGSVGSIGGAPVREVALGLMHSGSRFLWSVRKPPPEGEVSEPTDYTVEDLKAILPEKFLSLLEEGTGMVCGWAPQVEVLAHVAVGGFVSHCGWNSILESLWFGQPIATWPMYAEQQSNAFQLVREMGLAVEMRLSYDKNGGDLVTADELKEAITSLMDQDNEVRRRVKEMATMSRRALTEGGSSFNSLAFLIDDMIGVSNSSMHPLNLTHRIYEAH